MLYCQFHQHFKPEICFSDETPLYFPLSCPDRIFLLRTNKFLSALKLKGVSQSTIRWWLPAFSLLMAVFFFLLCPFLICLWWCLPQHLFHFKVQIIISIFLRKAYITRKAPSLSSLADSVFCSTATLPYSTLICIWCKFSPLWEIPSSVTFTSLPFC